MLWFTSDQHFFHENIRTYCGRPFASMEEMHEELIARHNALVRPTDLVINLGDFAFGKESEQRAIRERLNGRQAMVRGNHDRSEASLERVGFMVMPPNQVYTLDDDNVELVVLSHYPYWRDEYDAFDHKFRHRMPKDEGLWLLHGHTHNFGPRVRLPQWRKWSGQINVGVDHWDYRPVSEVEILEIIRPHTPKENR